MDDLGYRPALEHDVESRLAIGNGALGVRASLDLPTVASRPRVFVAGLFDVPEREPRLPALAPAPNWLRLEAAVGGAPLSLESGETLALRRSLDLRRGVLLADWTRRDATGCILRLRTLRCVSLNRRAVTLQLARLEVDRPAEIALGVGLEAAPWGLELEACASPLTRWRTARGTGRLAVATAAALWIGSRSLPPPEPDGLRQRWWWSARPGTPATLMRTAAIERGEVGCDPGPGVVATLERARRDGPARLLAAHARAWAARWAAADVEVEGDEAAQRALRFAVYHLVGAANPEDDRVSIGARGLTGEAYQGHIFWDTEIFLLPFFALTWPAAARALLRYRFHTLPAARAKAARLGYRGALYAWESADTGEEATPPWVVGPDGHVVPIRCGTLEQHISADVAYAVWQYWQATHDIPFLLDAGAEIVLETARFWASRAGLERGGSYHIRSVIGPDEYHEDVDDNAYTNSLARWNLERGLEVAGLLARRWPERWASLAQRLGITRSELAHWSQVDTGLVTGFDPATGLYEQFAGFFGLEPVDPAAYEPRTAPLDVLLGPERTRRSQVIKQADVVMLLALLGDRLEPQVCARNFRHYEPRCAHGSSLSPAVHALVAARLGDLSRAERFFRQGAAVDLDGGQGSAAQGVHIGALGGLWQAAVLGFGGVSLRRDGLRLDPCLPPTWRALRFAVQWRGRQLRVEVLGEPGTVTARLERGLPMRVQIGPVVHRLTRGATVAGHWRASGNQREEGSP